MGKKICGTNNFILFNQKASPSHNYFSEFFILEKRLVTSNMFCFIAA